MIGLNNNNKTKTKTNCTNVRGKTEMVLAISGHISTLGSDLVTFFWTCLA